MSVHLSKILKSNCWKLRNKKEMKAVITWFFTGGSYGGDVRVEGEYRGLTSLSLKSHTWPSSYRRTIMSVSYHMKLVNIFITSYKLNVQLCCCVSDFNRLSYFLR